LINTVGFVGGNGVNSNNQAYQGNSSTGVGGTSTSANGMAGGGGHGYQGSDFYITVQVVSLHFSRQENGIIKV
jgi:hypothetical protein